MSGHHPHNSAQRRLPNVLVYLKHTASILADMSDEFSSPLLKVISRTTVSLASEVQTVKRNKEECVLLLEQIHTLLCTVIRLHIQSKDAGSLAPSTLDHLAKFTETLQKIHVFVESQRESSGIRRFLRQSETKALLKDCKGRLEQALSAFKVYGVDLFVKTKDIQEHTLREHQEILALIETYMASGAYSNRSSMYGDLASSNTSSDSFELLPPEPKIFHGREAQLDHILHLLDLPLPRIAILGAGGIGKTSLAQTVLHNPRVIARFQNHRFFVSCDSAGSSVDIAALIGAQLKFDSAHNIVKKVVQHFTSGLPSLLVLDNMETPWEPLESRRDVEEFLSLLTDVPQLSLLITMRGAERPEKVQWTRPFLPSLDPLTPDAARQSFIDIADDIHDELQVDRLLAVTDNLPLAVNLIAHLVHDEGCPKVLARWETERALLLSGAIEDKNQNLDISIKLSLSSPRVTSISGARELLSLLSVLPDGISDVDLLQSRPDIQDIGAAKSALLRTSLAYVNHDGHLKVLTPVREYIQLNHPVSPAIILSVRRHFHALLNLYKQYRGLLSHGSSGPLLKRIKMNVGNLQQILLLGLNPLDPDLEQAVDCALLLGRFCHLNGYGRAAATERISVILPHIQNPSIHVRFIADSFMMWKEKNISNPDSLLTRAQALLPTFDDPEPKAMFFGAAAYFYLEHDNNAERATRYWRTALDLSRSAGFFVGQYSALNQLSWVKWKMGDFRAVLVYCREATAVANGLGDNFLESRSLRMESLAYYGLGDYKMSSKCAQQARELLTSCGIFAGDAHDSLANTEAEVHFYKSEYREARAIHSRTIKEGDRQQNPYYYALALQNVAAIDVVLGADTESIRVQLDDAKCIFSKMGHSAGLVYCDMALADLYLRDGDTLSAKILLTKCLDTSLGKITDATTFCLLKLSDIPRWPPADSHRAFTWAVTLLSYALKHQMKLETHEALRRLGNFALLEGDPDTAQSLISLALEGFTEMDVHHGRATCMLYLGNIQRYRGNMCNAVELWAAARPLFEKSSQAEQVKLVDDNVASASSL